MGAQGPRIQLKSFKKHPILRYLHLFFHAIFSTLWMVVVLYLVPILLPVSLVLRIYRRIHYYTIWFLYGDKVTPLNSDDAVWLHDTKGNKAIVNTMIEFSGKPDIHKFRSIILERVINRLDPENKKHQQFPKITQYVGKKLGRYVWIEDEDFDITEHVIEHTVCAPADINELQTMIGDICSRSLPERKALWQFIVIPPRPKSIQVFYVLFRVHHVVADGISLTRLTLHDLVDSPVEVSAPKHFGFVSTSKTYRTLKALFEGPGLILERALLSSSKNILHGPRPSGQKLVSWSRPVELSLVKDIKNATGTTVNDVLIACLACTLRDHFKRFSSSIPSNIVSSIPVDVRRPDAKLILDNQFSQVFMKISLDEESPLDLLAKTKHHMDEMENSSEPLVNMMLIRYGISQLPEWLAQATYDWFSDKACMVVTNIPGPESTLSMAGYPIEDMVFWVPQRKNVALSISIVSYNGAIRLGVIVDKVILSNPKLLVDGYESKLHEMAEALALFESGGEADDEQEDTIPEE